MANWDATKTRLLEAAGEEFAERGFEGATIRTICNRAGANVAAVNYHFGDKEQLYIQAVIEAHRCGVEMPSQEEFEAGAPADRLRRYVRHFLENILAVDRNNVWYYTLMLREMMRPTLASETLVREVIRPKFERLISILRVICPEAEDHRLYVVAFSVIGQIMQYRMGRQIAELLIGEAEFASFDLEYLTHHITSFSLAALGLAAPIDARGRFVQEPYRTPVGPNEGER